MIRWKDIAATVRDCYQSGKADSVLDLVSDWDSPLALYFAGALELARGEAEAALTCWVSLDQSAVPPDYLYSPWKLWRELKPQEANPFEAALTAGITLGRVRPLVDARFRALKTEYRAALEAYLKTDPAHWMSEDIQNLYRCEQYGPLQQQAGLLLAGALRRGRLRDEVRDLIEEIERRETAGDDFDLRNRLRLALTEDSALKEAAITVAKQQLDLRRAFAQSDFGEVLDYGEANDAGASSNETVLLVYLAAMGERQEELSDRWGTELRKRFPGKETLAWMESLKDL
jgi:hypothetical protein